MPGGELLCKMSRGIKIMADMTIEEAAKEEFDLIVCPGGMPGKIMGSAVLAMMFSMFAIF